jgi:secreted PhoX family phosphatase
MSQVTKQDFSDEGICNQSENVSFAKVLQANLSRRSLLKGGLGAASTAFFATSSITAFAGSRHGVTVGFTPVAIAEGTGPWPNIAIEYQWDVLLPWGEPLEPGGPKYNHPPNAADQAKQIGVGHDGMHLFPVKDPNKPRCGWNDDQDWDDGLDWSRNVDKDAYRRGNRHGILCINHEFGSTSHVLGKDVPDSLEDVRVMQHAHGVSIVELKKNHSTWRQVKSNFARRIHVNTPVEFSGPVAGSELLDTPKGNAPLGTVNNCANGYTPWGTYLTCEENFNGYFGATNKNNIWVPTPEQERYGFTKAGFGYGWQNFDKRFDLSDPNYQNEGNRFGWVVEIDPVDGTSKPVKRTALGRVKHEGIALTVGLDGRVVGYMGDDQRFDYIYKFVSEDNWRKMRREGRSPLDHGKLYVARFNDDGSGDWLELTMDNPDIAQRFNSQAEVLIYTRIAADIVGATPMDRPEWTTVGTNEMVYCTLTNNSLRTEMNAANSLAPNADGHIIRWKDSRIHTGTSFKWDIYLIAKTTHGTEDTFSDPDGLWADPDGRLFIQTDGGQKEGLNNQMLVADLSTGELRRLFTGVTSDEITGITTTPNRKTIFVNSQHPGNGDPSQTNFPAPFDGVTVPRDSTIVITRKDGGIVGT